MNPRIKPVTAELLTVTEIARIAKVSWHFAKKITAEKNFPKSKRIGKTNYWARSEVIAYFKL